LDAAFLHPDNFAGADFTELGDIAADEYILAVRGGGTGDVSESHLLWKHRTRYTDHIVSPFVSDGRLFLIKEGGLSTVFALRDGSPIRGPQRIGNGGSYFASPVLGDGKVYLAGENGRVIVLENGPDYKVLANNDVGESIVATPAISDGGLFVRTRTGLSCFALD
jgi:outer membrane protein assembly factor BamB